jgi:hypothetical protein
LLIETPSFVSRPGAGGLFEFRSRVSIHKFPGGLTARVTPVPIPNTEVKPCRADDTALETTRERRSPPGLNLKGRNAIKRSRPFFILRARMLIGSSRERGSGRALTSKNETTIATISGDDLSNLDDASRGRA